MILRFTYHILLTRSQLARSIPRLILILQFSILPHVVTFSQDFNEEAILEIEGAIKIGVDSSHVMTGTIRWNAIKKDFEGFNGENWVSFTEQASIPSFGTLAVSQNEKIVHPDTLEDAFFGGAVDIFGRYAIVGSLQDSINLVRSGSARIYKKVDNKWTELDLLFPQDGFSGQLFGGTVSLDSNFAFVAAELDDEYGSNTGAVYVYKNLGAEWKFYQKLLPSKLDSLQRFGNSLDLYEQTVVIGAANDFSLDSVGRSYVFEFDGSNWNEVEILFSNQPTSEDNFGWDVAIYDKTIIASSRKTSISDQGEVSVFSRSDTGWYYQNNITVPVSSANKEFGYAIDISDEILVVGTPNNYFPPNSNPGSVYIYRLIDKDWILEDHVFASDGHEFDAFGGSVDLYNDCLLIGASKHNLNNTINSGAAYLFQPSHGSWSQTRKLIPDDPTTGASFGQGVAIWGNQIIIGAFLDEVNSDNSGAIYIF